MTSRDAVYYPYKEEYSGGNQENTEKPLKRGLPVLCIAYLCYSSMKSCNQFLRLKHTGFPPCPAMPKNNVPNSLVNIGIPIVSSITFSSIVRRLELLLQLPF